MYKDMHYLVLFDADEVANIVSGLFMDDPDMVGSIFPRPIQFQGIDSKQLNFLLWPIYVDG